MISLISPAKSLNYKDPCPIPFSSALNFKTCTAEIVNHLKHYEPSEFATMMKISEKLAQQVFDYYLNFDPKNYTTPNAKQALFAFNGDVYRSIEAATLTQAQCEYAQEHVGILSGLYGLARPMDLVQPYRLEMGTRISFKNGNLYDFWQKTLTKALQERLNTHASKTIINLASNEYSQAINKKDFQNNWIDIDFKEFKEGKYKTVGIFAKRARGMMIRHILDHNIDTPDELKNFNVSNYEFNNELSSPNKFTFTRLQP